MAEPDLCSVPDVTAALNVTLDEGETEQVKQAITRVSNAIRSRTGRSFGAVKAGVTIRCQADWRGVITLSSLPVHEVSAVTDIDGFPPPGWHWDGLAEIYGLASNQVIDVTISHGYADIPDDIRDVAIGATARLAVNPTGVRQETVGAISVTYPAAGGTAGSVAFSDEEADILGRFGGGPASWRL